MVNATVRPARTSQREWLPLVKTCEIQRARGWKRLMHPGYDLRIGPHTTGRIFTFFTTSPFSGADEVRETKADFGAHQWIIRAVEPSEPNPTKTTVFGNPKRVRFPISERVIAVFAQGHPIAYTHSPTPARSSARVIASGRSFTVTPPRKAHKGTIDGHGTLQRNKNIWAYTASKPTPLSVVLLHWHLLLGDWKALEVFGYDF